jgi:hypothetical protein
MSCGFAISRELDESEERNIKDLVEKCFHGTRPLAPGIFESDEILPNW